MNKILYNGNKNIISKRLAEARTATKLSQSQLAARLQVLNVNIDQQSISKIEKNQRQVTDYEIMCLCRCLKVDPAWLMQDFDEYNI